MLIVPWFLQAQGFTAEDFNVMCGITSWATCGPGHSRGMSILEEHVDTYTDGQRSDGHLNKHL